MSLLIELEQDAAGIDLEIKERTQEARELQRLHYVPAMTIQKHVRGHITRVHILELRKCAITIQSYWRMFSALLNTARLVQLKFNYMNRSYYHSMANKIQAFWRGYLVRKNIANFSGRRMKLEKIRKANEQMKIDITIIKEDQVKNEAMLIEKQAGRLNEFILRKVHHLMRTKAKEGVLSNRGSQEPSEVEEMLKSLKFKDYITKLNKTKNKLIREVCIEVSEKHEDISKSVGTLCKNVMKRNERCKNDRLLSLKKSVNRASLGEAQDQLTDNNFKNQSINQKPRLTNTSIKKQRNLFTLNQIINQGIKSQKDSKMLVRMSPELIFSENKTHSKTSDGTDPQQYGKEFESKETMKIPATSCGSCDQFNSEKFPKKITKITNIKTAWKYDKPLAACSTSHSNVNKASSTKILSSNCNSLTNPTKYKKTSNDRIVPIVSKISSEGKLDKVYSESCTKMTTTNKTVYRSRKRISKEWAFREGKLCTNAGEEIK